jgi:hypothetical protein
LVFSSLIGHNTYFTQYLNDGPRMAYLGTVPYGPTHEEC